MCGRQKRERFQTSLLLLLTSNKNALVVEYNMTTAACSCGQLLLKPVAAMKRILCVLFAQFSQRSHCYFNNSLGPLLPAEHYLVSLKQNYPQRHCHPLPLLMSLGRH